MKEMIKNRTLVKLFFLAFIFRAVYTLFITHQIVFPDSISYLNISENLISGHGYSIQPDIPTARRTPVYPLFLAFLFSVFMKGFSVILIVQSLIDSFTCMLVYYLAKEIFDEKVAMISFLLRIFYPVSLAYCGFILTETVYSFFLVFTALLIYKAVRLDSLKYHFFAGLFLGLALLTRSEIILFSVFVLISEYLMIGRIRKTLVSYAIFIFAVILLYTPWLVRNYKVLGDFYPGQSETIGYLVREIAWYAERNTTGKDPAASKSFQEYFEGLLKEHDIHKTDKIMLREAQEYIIKHPLKVVLLYVKRFPGFWITSHSAVFGIRETNSEYLQKKKYHILAIKSILLFLQAVILILAVIGIYFQRIQLKKILLVFLFAFYPSFVLLISCVSRHHVPYMSFVLIFTAVAINGLLNMLIEHNKV